MAVSRFAPEWDGDEETPETSDGAAAVRGGRRKRLTGWKGFLRDLLVILVAAIVISFLIKTFLIRSFYIPSQSMENTLLVNDRIIVNELEPKLMPVHRGDVVVFEDPGGWLPGEQNQSTQASNPVSEFFDGLLSIVGLTAPDSDDHLIKRVIGLPGDHVKCCNQLGQLSVNGVPLDESPYIHLPQGETKATREAFSVTVPKDSLWVMGDNRWNSCDSVCNRDKPGKGFVPESDVVGRAIVITWPTSRWGALDDFPLVFADVDEKDSGG